MFEQTKALCDLFLEMGIPSFDLMVCKDGQCVCRYFGGYADANKNTPINGTEKYHIYSCSKLFTCVAAMQLWEKGLFSLDDPISKFIPEFGEMTVKTESGIKKAEHPILIHHLFEMTSGLSYALRTPELKNFYENSTCPTVELVKEFAKRPLEFEPGTRWLYSLSHDVLGALVEILSGQKFQDYAKEHIFDPLGMTNTDFLHPIDDWTGFAAQYNYREGEYVLWRKNTYRPGPEYVSGGAGCVSTVEDYIKFLEALRVGDIILKTQTIEMMTANRLTPAQMTTYTQTPNGLGYGLGFRTPHVNPKRHEFGWGGAAGAFCAVDKQLGVSIYYSQHVLNSPNNSLRAWLYYTIKADIMGEQIQLPKPDQPTNPNITY